MPSNERLNGRSRKIVVDITVIAVVDTQMGEK
jgi:hypothetical protein